MNTLVLDNVIKSVEQLPKVSQSAIAVMRMLDDPDVEVDDLARAIMLDEALTLQVLKLCNSASYGFAKKIISLQEAIAKLGLKTLKRLVYVAISHGVLNRDIKGYGLQGKSLWAGSLYCGMYAKHIAQKIGYRDIEGAFIAGLLRDVGKLVIDEYVEINYDKIVKNVYEKNLSFADAEEETLGFNHTQLGYRLMERWGFPQSLIEVVRYHHSIKEASQEKNLTDIKLIAIVNLADLLTVIMAAGVGSDGLMYNLEDETLHVLGLNEKNFCIDELLAELLDLEEEINKMLGMFN